MALLYSAVDNCVFLLPKEFNIEQLYRNIKLADTEFKRRVKHVAKWGSWRGAEERVTPPVIETASIDTITTSSRVPPPEWKNLIIEVKTFVSVRKKKLRQSSNKYVKMISKLSEFVLIKFTNEEELSLDNFWPIVQFPCQWRATRHNFEPGF